MPDVYKQPMIELQPVVAGFYALQELSLVAAQLERQSPTCERDSPKNVIERQVHWKLQAQETAWSSWTSQVRWVQKRYEAELAALFFDYLFRAACGEARLARSTRLHIAELWGGNRWDTVKDVAKYHPKQALTQMYQLYKEGRWGGGYGGDKWATICEMALMYKEVPDAVFIDHVVDLTHNGGLAFNKGFLVSVYHESDYLAMLNVKRDGTIFCAPRSYPLQVINLMNDAPKGVLPTDWQGYPGEAFHYTPQPWGDVKLSAPAYPKCLACNEEKEEEIWCSNCKKCEECCECFRCSHCWEKYDGDGFCFECDRCTDCCNCFICGKCGEKQGVKEDTCEWCATCIECCTCGKCPACGELHTEDELLKCCGMCEDCCECVPCETCKEINNVDCPVCTPINENQLELNLEVA